MTPIRTLVDGCLDRAAGAPGAAAIWRVWEDAVGSVIARRAVPVRLRGHTLIVAVTSAPWMQELMLMKPAIRTALNARLPEPIVADLYFVASEQQHLEHPDPAPPPARRCTTPPATVRLDGLPEAVRASFADFLRVWQRAARGS